MFATQTKLPKVGTTIFTVMSQLALAHKAVNLGQGFPDFEGPEALRAGLNHHTHAGKNQYAPMPGILPLREQIASKCALLYGAKLNPESEITVTSGATEALFVAIAALVRAGEEVIVLDPCYDSYEPAIELIGAKAVHVPLVGDGFDIDWQRLADAINDNTRMIMINTPHNPSGAVLSAPDLDRLAALIRERNIVLLSDEVYEHIVFDGLKHLSVLSHAELKERSVAVFSFGKTYHITGWKVGYMVAPAALSVELRKVHQYLTFCTFHAAQWALSDYMASGSQHHLELSAFYQAKRDYFAHGLKQSRFRLLPVQGAYFQLVDYSAISDKPDTEFARWLTESVGVAAIPVSAFYEQAPDSRIVRFCFAKQQSTLDAALEKLIAV